jgi:uncharacterized protein YuzE
MKIDFDEETDSAYLSLDESKIVDSEELLCDVVFDYDEHDQVVGVEVLRFSQTFPLCLSWISHSAAIMIGRYSQIFLLKGILPKQ